MTGGGPAAAAERLVWATEALHGAAVISAAHRLDLLAQLESGPVRAVEAARACAADPDRTAILLEALGALGLAELDQDGRFRAAVPALAVLGRMAAGSSLLAEAVRSGRAPLGCDGPVGAARVYPEAVTGLAALVATRARAVAELLPAPGERILDVGAGAAPWSLAIADRDPRCRVTALDLPAVLPTTRRMVADADHADRFDYLAGDVFEVPLPGKAFDLVLLGNLCHLFDGPANRRLLCRLVPAVRPEGHLAVLDVLPSDERSVRLYAAGLLTRTSTGGLHRPESYRRWYEEAGLGDVRVIRVDGAPPVSLVIGRRPPN